MTWHDIRHDNTSSFHLAALSTYLAEAQLQVTINDTLKADNNDVWRHHAVPESRLHSVEQQPKGWRRVAESGNSAQALRRLVDVGGRASLSPLFVHLPLPFSLPPRQRPDALSSSSWAARYTFAIMSVAAPTVPQVEEGKLLSESLSTVKIQVQQMKRHLVCTRLLASSSPYSTCAARHRSWTS